jgi:hypothetical protein
MIIHFQTSQEVSGEFESNESLKNKQYHKLIIIIIIVAVMAENSKIGDPMIKVSSVH